MSIKIFLSSAKKDLDEIRKAIIKEIDKFYPFMECVAMEKDSFWKESPSQKTSIDNLKKSDVYLLVIGSIYKSKSIIDECQIDDCPLKGKECNGKISFTHCEYRFAKAKGMPMLYLKIWVDSDRDKEL